MRQSATYCCAPLSPDEFLLVLWSSDAARMALILEEQAAAIGREVGQVLERLRRDAPRFIGAVETSGLLV
jgi:hypothetical protein